MTVLYLSTSTGYTELIAASEDERKLEEEVFAYCKKINVNPEYYRGEYRFERETAVGTISAWLHFEKVKVI